MSKILELPKFKPVVCPVCGCKYEFEIGDTLQPIMLSSYTRDCNCNIQRKKVGALNLSCPICGASNNVKLEVEAGE